MNRYDARKFNLKKIIDSQYNGNIKYFATNILKLGTPSELYNYFSGYRKIQDNKAQEYEAKLGLELGTLDKCTQISKVSTTNAFIEIPEIKVTTVKKKSIIQFEEPETYAIPVLKSWFEKKNINPADVVFFEIKDDSMEDSLKNGDYVLIDKSQTKLYNPEIYAFWYGDCLFIKRLFKDGTEIIAKPDNPKHHHDLLITPEKAKINKFSIIGKVVFRMG